MGRSNAPEFVVENNKKEMHERSGCGAAKKNTAMFFMRTLDCCCSAYRRKSSGHGTRNRLYHSCRARRGRNRIHSTAEAKRGKNGVICKCITIIPSSTKWNDIRPEDGVRGRTYLKESERLVAAFAKWSHTHAPCDRMDVVCV